MCPKEYQYARIRKVREFSPFLSAPLSIGLLLHAARAQWLYDNRKGDLWRERMVAYAKDVEENEKGLHPASMPIAVQTFEAYEAFWRVRPPTQVLAVEHELKPRALTPEQQKPGMQWSWRGARLDSIEKHQGKVWIGEFKSTSDAPQRVTDIYTLNGQTLLQAALWGKEETEKFGPLAGILLDVLKKPRGKSKPKAYPRVQMPLSQMEHALKWFRKDFAMWVMQSSMIEWNTGVERRPVCMRSYGPCEYRTLCLRGRAGSNRFILEDGTKLAQWQPSPGKEVPPWE